MDGAFRGKHTLQRNRVLRIVFCEVWSKTWHVHHDQMDKSSEGHIFHETYIKSMVVYNRIKAASQFQISSQGTYRTKQKKLRTQPIRFKITLWRTLPISVCQLYKISVPKFESVCYYETVFLLDFWKRLSYEYKNVVA